LLRDRQLAICHRDTLGQSLRASHATREQTTRFRGAILESIRTDSLFHGLPWLTAPDVGGKIEPFDELSTPEILPLETDREID
jgi:hypothetical protein